MKEKIFLILTILCFSLLAFGKFHWDGKIEKVNNNIASTSTAVASERNEEDNKKEENNKTFTDNDVKPDYYKNLPSPLETMFESKYANNEDVNLIVVGSKGLTGENSWPNLLKKELEDSYKLNFNLHIQELEGNTSSDVLQNNLLNIPFDPHIIIFEPFTIEDNFNVIPINQRFINIEETIEEFQKLNSDVVTIVQPSIPLYNAVNYPREMEALEQFATSNDYIYLNHWEYWPSYTSSEFLDYVTDDRMQPNDAGNELWAKYLKDFFLDQIENFNETE